MSVMATPGDQGPSTQFVKYVYKLSGFIMFIKGNHICMCCNTKDTSLADDIGQPSDSSETEMPRLIFSNEGHSYRQASSYKGVALLINLHQLHNNNIILQCFIQNA